jgi:hypothetical protein
MPTAGDLVLSIPARSLELFSRSSGSCWSPRPSGTSHSSRMSTCRRRAPAPGLIRAAARNRYRLTRTSYGSKRAQRGGRRSTSEKLTARSGVFGAVQILPPITFFRECRSAPRSSNPRRSRLRIADSVPQSSNCNGRDGFSVSAAEHRIGRPAVWQALQVSRQAVAVPTTTKVSGASGRERRERTRPPNPTGAADSSHQLAAVRILPPSRSRHSREACPHESGVREYRGAMHGHRIAEDLLIASRKTVPARTPVWIACFAGMTQGSEPRATHPETQTVGKPRFDPRRDVEGAMPAESNVLASGLRGRRDSRRTSPESRSGRAIPLPRAHTLKRTFSTSPSWIT